MITRRKFGAALILLGFMADDLIWGAQPYHAKHAMVVSGETNATDVGLGVLKAGGNAIDAAVAMGFVLGVTHSGMTGLGGGGYILVRMADGRTAFFDFREQAPGRASRDMFLDAKGDLSKDSVIGWKAAAVPGNVKGYETAHKKFGTKPWADLLQPAIKLAAQGHPVSWMHAGAFRTPESVEKLGQFAESKRIFLNGGRYYEPGDLLVQKDLGQTLERIARHGARDFYKGETAASLHYLAEAMRRFFADRSEYIGDPDYFHVPYDTLLSPEHITSLRASIDPVHATGSDKLRPGKLVSREGGDTTHFAGSTKRETQWP